MILEFHVRGLRDLENAWLELARDVGPRRARRVFNKGLLQLMRPLSKEIQRVTPKRIYRIADTARKPRVRSRTRQNIRHRSLISRLVVAAGSGYVLQNRVGYWQALAIEYGTKKIREQANIRKSYNKHLPRIIAQTPRVLRKIFITRAAEIRAKHRGR